MPYFFVVIKEQSIVLPQRLPKAEMWAIVEIATFIFNPIGLVCVMNQSKGCYLLSSALTTIIAINEPKISKPFEVKIFPLHIIVFGGHKSD
jgi:hypothetical protein